MKLLLAFALMIGAQPALAQSVLVQSGDHDTFTRLVMTFPSSVDWSLSRTAEGYALQSGKTGLRYDVRDAYRRISRDRLSSIFADPEDGTLRLGVGCDCHAIPFELRPDVVVVDIRDGPAPEGSSFELASSGDREAQLRPRPTLRPKDRPQTEPANPVKLPAADEWRAATQQAARGAPKSQAAQVPLMTEDSVTSDLRETLLWQLSQGASAGVVEIAKTLPPGKDTASSDLAKSTQVRIGREPGLAVDSAERQPDHMTAQGKSCIADTQLDIASWGDPAPVVQALGPVLSGLVGEFDRPDAVAVTRAVRYLLYIGFGQEALMTLKSLDIAAPDRAIWETIAHILEDDSSPGAVFADMEVCDTAAALWAVLSAPQIGGGQKPKTTAILRSFSNLPLALRRHLGPRLADRFLQAGDTLTATTLREAILRASGELGAEVRLMDAKIDLSNGDHQMGERKLQEVSKEPGPAGIDALIALVGAQVQAGDSVDPSTIPALEAHYKQAKGSQLQTDLTTALALAYASQNEFDKAFALDAGDDIATKEVWSILADRGSDRSLLNHAIKAKAADLPKLTETATLRLSGRLVDLGFGDAALLWLSSLAADGAQLPAEARLLGAKAHLVQRDYQSALSTLAGLTGSEAEALRASAMESLQDPEALKHYGNAGLIENQNALVRKIKDWGAVANADQPESWRAAASLVTAPAPTEEAALPPLASSRAAIEESAASRAVLETLLAELRAKDPTN